MKSVLFINYEYPPVGAGGATACHQFATRFAARGTKTVVLTSAFRNRRGTSTEEGVTVCRIPSGRKRAAQSSLLQMFTFVVMAVFTLPRILRTQRPDLTIIFFAFPCGPLGVLLQLIWKLPYVIMLRGSDVPGSEPSLDKIHRALRPVRRIVYRNSSALIANSNGLRRIALQSDPDIAVEVVPNGVDTDFFRPHAGASQTADHQFTFLFAGRICVQKNLVMLIEAFAQCRASRRNCRLVMIGEGPELAHLRREVHARSLDAAVQWTGWCTREVLRSYYQSADCFVCPSINEGMSNAILEAMACGLAVLASDCPGNRDIVVEGKSGYLFTITDSSALSERMVQYVSEPSPCYEQGRFARTLTCERFSWNSSARMLHSLIRNRAPYR
jgi:glycogen synthase